MLYFTEMLSYIDNLFSSVLKKEGNVFFNYGRSRSCLLAIAFVIEGQI